MKQLSGLDATFLFLETSEMPMHVGALHVLELPAGHKGKFVVDLRRHMAQRLVEAPVLRRRLWWMPLNLANPAWVDAEPDLRQHIVEIKLPASARHGSGLAELEAQVGALHPVLLDRSRPLWKFHVFEGLAPAPNGHKRVGLYSQLHHAAVDGQAAVALARIILDTGPVPRSVVPRAATGHKAFALGLSEMLRGAIANEAQQVAQIVRNLPSTVGTLKNAASQAIRASTLLRRAGSPEVSNVTLAPRTPLNVSVTTGRVYATVSLPLPELKALGQAHGATVNDMVLMVCASALRRHYGKTRALPRKSMVAAVPISLRAAGDTTADTQASMSLVSLGTHIADPVKRLAHVKAASLAMKSTMGGLKSILPTDFPSIGVPWLIEAATALYGRARVAEKIPQVANLVISNVPGPPVPLYLAGARMLTNHPTSIITHGLALNITVQSYGHSLDFGLMADAVAMPDVRDLADAIRIAFDDIRALPLPGTRDGEASSRVGAALSRSGRTVGKAVSAAAGGIGALVPGAVKKAAATTLPDAAQGLLEAAVRHALSQVPGIGSATQRKRPRGR